MGDEKEERRVARFQILSTYKLAAGVVRTFMRDYRDRRVPLDHQHDNDLVENGL